MNKITYQEIVDQVVAETGLSKQSSHDILENLGDVIELGLMNDGYVRIKGLGAFQVRSVADRQGINPRTGEPIEIPAHNKVVFRADQTIKQHLNPPGPTQTRNNQQGNNATMIERLKDKRIFGYAALALAALVVVVIAVIGFGDEPAEPAVAENPPGSTAPVIAPDTADEEVVASVEEAATPAPEPEPQTPEPEVPPPPPPAPEPKTYQLAKGDNLWNLAAEHFGDPYLWPLLYQANSDIIDNPDVMQIGLEIIIPQLDGEAGNLADSDKEKLVSGNLLAYKVYQAAGEEDAGDYLKVAQKIDPGVKIPASYAAPDDNSGLAAGKNSGS